MNEVNLSMKTASAIRNARYFQNILLFSNSLNHSLRMIRHITPSAGGSIWHCVQLYWTSNGFLIVDQLIVQYILQVVYELYLIDKMNS